MFVIIPSRKKTRTVGGRKKRDGLLYRKSHASHAAKGGGEKAKVERRGQESAAARRAFSKENAT